MKDVLKDLGFLGLIIAGALALAYALFVGINTWLGATTLSAVFFAAGSLTILWLAIRAGVNWQRSRR